MFIKKTGFILKESGDKLISVKAIHFPDEILLYFGKTRLKTD